MSVFMVTQFLAGRAKETQSKKKGETEAHDAMRAESQPSDTHRHLMIKEHIWAKKMAARHPCACEGARKRPPPL